MSPLLMAAALRVRGLFPAERLLFTYLVDRANDERVCWPAVDEIADDLELSPRKINQATAALEQRKLISVERRYKQSSIFRILDIPERPQRRPNGRDNDAVSAAHSVRSSAVHAAQREAVCGAFSAPSAAHSVRSESHIESLIDSTTTTASTSPAREAAAAAPEIDNSQVIQGAWNRMAERSGLPPVVLLTPQRRRDLAERVAEHGVDGILDAIGRIGASSFCRGGGQRGWKADFEFLLDPATLTRAREGRYDDRNPLTGWERFDRLWPGGLPSSKAGFDASETWAPREPDPEPDAWGGVTIDGETVHAYCRD